MGRLAFRAAWNNPQIDIVHINEIKGGTKTAAHLLKFDSVHGKWNEDITVTEDKLHIQKQSITFSEYSSPEQVPWDTYGVSIVLECTGKFLTPETLGLYFKRNVVKVIVSAPVKEGALNIVMGVNDHLYNPDKHHIITAASCTTNCLAPLVKVIHENIGIRHGMITTVHDVTNTQSVVDVPHKDLRRARSCLSSLIPTTTGSATAIALIYPELKGKLNGHAICVPLCNASLTDVVFEVNRSTTVEEVNQLFKEASTNGSLVGILGYEELPLVSVDYRGDVRSAIVDALSTMVTDGTQVKLFAWYDNEWGYVNRMIELLCKVAITLNRK
jgi:glyceraldehyde 3-phosphate dehydrogenase